MYTSSISVHPVYGYQKFDTISQNFAFSPQSVNK